MSADADKIGELVPLMKAHFLGDSKGQQSNILPESEKAKTVFEKIGALPPPYDPQVLSVIYENSSALRPNVDAYITNIDSYGHHYKPVIDLDVPEADETIANAIRTERAFGGDTLIKAEDGEDVDISKEVTEPTSGDVSKRKERIRKAIRKEAADLKMFFSQCTVAMPFDGPEGLRGLTRMDVEVTGNGYWEVLRGSDGKKIVAFNRLPSNTTRYMPLNPEPVKVSVRRHVSELSFTRTDINKQFRTFVQTSEDGSRSVFFKEFGDPRTVSARTGRFYASEELMRAQDDEKDAPVATEVIAFKISSPRSPYGIPRWVGVLLSVMGNRQAEEANFLWFENRSIPPMAVLVSGGRLNEDTIKRLEDYISTEIRGKHNIHKILILEAEAAASGVGYPAQGEPDAGRMRIQLVPLSQQTDAIFQSYDERNADKVGQAFRLPRLLRGDVRDFNRSTAEASVDFAEIQVFGPIRQQFDWLMNQLILPELGIKYHTFESNAPTVRDPKALAEIITMLVTANVLTPGEARDFAELVFNKPLPQVDADWTTQPISVTVAGRKEEFEAAGGMSADGAGKTQQSLGVSNKSERIAKILEKVHAELLKQQREEFRAEEGADVVKVPAHVFYEWFAQ